MPNDTIVAISTPPGRGGIGVIRISGNDALSHTRTLIADDFFNPTSHKAYLRKLYEPSSAALIDHALVTYFQSPHTFTGEDTVELSCHGSPVVLLSVLDVLLSLGARSAEPGEFTLRAFFNGKLNLSQAEALKDLIDAKTTSAMRLAARQLNGELSSRLQPIKDEIIKLIVLFESALEFVEDDLPEDLVLKAQKNLENLIVSVESFLRTFQSGRLLKEGIKVTLVGRPNVGKSSIFNMLLENNRAIVTAFAGTTRDTINETLVIKGIPVSLTDTAGLRESNDAIERIGIERTRQAISDADLVLIVLDADEGITADDTDLINKSANLPHLIALNKIDLSDNFSHKIAELEAHHTFVRVSALTCAGAESLRNAIVAKFASETSLESDDFVLTNARHYDLMLRAGDSIRASKQSLNESKTEEIVVVGLHDALRYLGEITGEVSTEDVLTEIFSTFCIGK